MCKRHQIALFIVFLAFSTPFLYANMAITPAVSALPTDALHANWLFVGLVSNEQGEQYGYFFKMQRQEQTFHVIAALFDAQTKKNLALEDAWAILPETKVPNWQVGRAFLKFNSVNESWVFGLKTKDKKGFNFKVDMLSPADALPVTKVLRPGVLLMINQTARLNGHLWIPNAKNEIFVMAKNTWFRQVWLENTYKIYPTLQGVLCRFDNGSGFYSVNAPSREAMHGAVAGWSNEQGSAEVMSQFISVKQQASNGFWHIRISSPNLHLVLADPLKQDSTIAGFVTKGKNTGFCMLSSDSIGAVAIERPTLIAKAESRYRF